MTLIYFFKKDFRKKVLKTVKSLKIYV